MLHCTVLRVFSPYTAQCSQCFHLVQLRKRGDRQTTPFLAPAQPAQKQQVGSCLVNANLGAVAQGAPGGQAVAEVQLVEQRVHDAGVHLDHACAQGQTHVTTKLRADELVTTSLCPNVCTMLSAHSHGHALPPGVRAALYTRYDVHGEATGAAQQATACARCAHPE